jgi:hypothetical protein
MQARPFPEVELLLVELGRAYSLVGMYQGDHPSLAGRVEAVHRSLADRIGAEPSGRLLLGIAKDKVLYRDAFLGCAQPLVHRLTEALFLNQVATVDFSAALSPDDLLAFFRALHRIASRKTGESFEGLLKDWGVRGVGVYPYNYKDVLSRRIVSSSGDGEEAGEPSAGRENELWRMLLTENAGDDASCDATERLFVSPEIFPAVLKRAYAASEAGIRFASTQDTGAEPVSIELVQKLLGRVGEMIGQLPADRKAAVIAHLDRGFEEMAGDGVPSDASLEYMFGRALTAGHSDDEFLDMLAAFLSAGDKGGRRLGRIFEIIASERNAGQGLVPKAREQLRESRRTRGYYAEKTWEAVETFLLARSEDAYIGAEHGNLLEALSSLGDGKPPASGTIPVPPAYAEAFSDEALHRKSLAVLLELITGDSPEEDYLGALEDIRKSIPNLVSRNEVDLLLSVLVTLGAIADETEGPLRDAIRAVFGEADFAHIVDRFLSPGLPDGDRETLQRILLSVPGDSIGAILDRLLVEGTKSNRRALLGLCARLSPVAVPAIVGQFGAAQWYYLRNLCLILGEIGDPSAAPDVAGLLDHPDYRVKREAILSLGKMRAQESLPFLGRILLSDSLLPSIREDALRIDSANAIFRIGGTRAASWLHRGLDCRRTVVREHCATLLKTMRPA